MSRLREMLARLLPPGGFVHSVAVLAGGTAAGQAIALLAAPLITRIYTPEDMGVLAVYASVMGIIGVVANMRYEIAIPIAGDDDVAANLLALSFLLNFVTTALTALAVIFFGTRFATLMNAEALVPYLWLIPAGMFALGTYQAMSYWAIRRKAFPRIARTKLTQAIANVGIQLAVGIATAGPLGLLLGQAVGQAAGTSTLAALAYRADAGTLRKVSFPGIRRAAGAFRRFPLISTWSSLANSGGLRVPALLFAALFGSSVAGLFGLGMRVVATPMSLVSTSVAQVYMSRLSSMRHTEPEKMHAAFKAVAGRLFRIGIGPTIVLAAGASWLFSLVFGDTWFEAGTYVQLTATMLLAQFVVSPLSQTLNIVERQDLQLIWDVGRLVATIVAIWLPWFLGLPAWASVAAYGATSTVAYLVLYLLCSNVLRARSTPV